MSTNGQNRPGLGPLPYSELAELPMGPNGQHAPCDPEYVTSMVNSLFATGLLLSSARSSIDGEPAAKVDQAIADLDRAIVRLRGWASGTAPVNWSLASSGRPPPPQTS